MWKKKSVMPFLLGIAFAALFFTICAPSGEKSANDGATSPQMRIASAEAQNDSGSMQDDIENSRENAITRAVARVSPAVVSVNVTQVQQVYRTNPFMNDPFFRHFYPYDKVMREVHGLGSGFLFSEQGHILTNQHVIDNADKIVVTLPGGEKFDAEIIGEDYKTDIAVIKISGRDFPFVTFGNSDDVIIGEWSIAVGNPFGLFDLSAKPTVTVGVISAVGQDFSKDESDRFYQDMIQTDAAINSGNSGGPLVNSYGQVIGINTIIYSVSSDIGANIGLGFAIPINRVKTVLADLLKFGSIQRNIWTQIQFEDVTPMVAFYLRMNSTQGTIVTNVERGSAWAEAGLETEDVIIEINGKTIKSTSDIERLKKEITPQKGDTILLKVFRNRQVYRAEVTY